MVPIILCLVVSCNLFLKTQVAFENATTSYTFTEIKIGTVDVTTPLPPAPATASVTAFVPIDPGSYTLFTKGMNGIWYQWPVPQPFDRGYSCLITFRINSENYLTYSTYATMIPP